MNVASGSGYQTGSIVLSMVGVAPISLSMKYSTATGSLFPNVSAFARAVAETILTMRGAPDSRG